MRYVGYKAVLAWVAAVSVGTFAVLAVANVGDSTLETVTAQQSAIKQLGQGADFVKTDQVFLSNPNFWADANKQDQIAYRVLRADVEADVLIAAFDVDNKGFCNHDMILEVFYRDDIRQWTDENGVQGTTVVKSRIDFAKDNEYVEVGHLSAEGDGKWKIARIFLERTLRQTIRAIDGSFQFKIVTSKSKACTIPVSYIKLSSVTHSDLVALRGKDRSQRGLQRVEYEPVSGEREFPGRAEAGFVVYPVNCLELVFPNSYVDHGEVNKPLQCFEVPGQAEPVAFVIHAYEDLKNVRVVVSDLHGAGAAIPSGNIAVRKVEYNDQRWGWDTERRYGSCPDYLSFENPVVDVKANSNCQFWLTINVPETAAAGFYKGEVEIYMNGEKVQTIPLSVEVLPIKLLPSRVKHMICHSPYLRNFHRDPIKVLQDMKEHGLVPIFYPPSWLVSTKDGLDVTLDGFEHQLQSLKKVYPKAEKLFVGLDSYYAVWRELGGGKPEFTDSFAKFDTTYGRILKRYAELADRYGFELYFSFNDEPFTRLEPRRASYLCSRIARANGLKTWSAHCLGFDVQLQLTQHELDANVNYLRPLGEVLDVFVEHIGRIDQKAVERLGQYPFNLSFYTTYAATSVWPTYNRFMHGWYPFAIDAEFVVSYAYRDSIVDAYDDLDVRANNASSAGMNDYLLTYPTWQGEILPTLSYEALREGVEDSLLISTMLELIQRAQKSDSAQLGELAKDAESFWKSILGRIHRNFNRGYWQKHRSLPIDPMEEAMLKDLSGDDNPVYGVFDKIRRQICDRIIILQNALEKERHA